MAQQPASDQKIVYIIITEDTIAKSTVIARTQVEKAYLVAVARKGSAERKAAEISVEELGDLAHTAGARVAGKTVQQLDEPSKTHYVGKGKLEELKSLRDSVDYNVVVFDDELSPLQQRNLEEALDVKVIDRAALILDIFARRARTHEGRLQVELAQHQYLLPRLAGQWSHLERLGGGIGTRGPGESQLETDRRLIGRKVHRLNRKIEEIRKHRSLYRHRRQKSGIPVVSLVGYTSAGKSTLMNALCQADVRVDEKLFATLDPTTRRLTLPGGDTVLLTDTVGFIRKLPPAIVNAFRATLEELSEASMLLHVVDLSAGDAAEQHQVVEDILGDLKIAGRPRLTVLNKIDLVLPAENRWDEASALEYLSAQEPAEGAVLVSATRGWGLSKLLEKIERVLSSPPE